MWTQLFNLLESPAISGLIAVLILNIANASPDEAADREARSQINESLKKLAKGEGEWKRLSITYDDLHGLHGGLTLSIDGSGKVTQKAVREKAGEARDVSEADLKSLLALLIEHEVWEQKVPERKAVPDESRARLTITYDGKTSRIWEWHNDLKSNKRMIVIREAMKKAAWKSVPDK